VIVDVFVTDMAGNQYPEPCDALVDTGADISAVPLRVCRFLRLAHVDEIKLSGCDRSLGTVRRPLFHVQIITGVMKPFPLSVAGLERDSILLGRDFLSKLKLILAVDGRRAAWQLEVGSRRKSMLLRLLALC
jgi:hypothetical protein